MADTGQAQHSKQVKAAHPFKGANNDELVFIKGDIITVTQCIEGGWWEGTLNGKTGWFPSNYVRDLKPGGDGGPKKEAPKVAPKPIGIVASPAKEAGINKRESMLRYRDLVLQNLTDTERTFTTDLQNLLQTYLRPLQQAAILSPAEFLELTGNLEEVVPLHQAVLTALTDCAKQPNPQQRIGGLFIKTAPQLRKLYELYCGNHPKAVGILQNRKDDLCKFMESKGAKAPGVMVLTTSLSRPFTRLDKYPNVLKEVERHTEESHADRGDTQRAISVYKEIATSCAEIRKMKEMEVEILNSNIVGWEGEEISQLGSVLSLTHVRVHSENGEKKEHLFLLFPSVLVMLSLGPRMSGFVYEGKLPVSGMTVNPLEDTENYTHAFEITGGMIDRRVVSCATASEQKHWVEALRQQAKHGPPPTPGKPQSLQISTSQPSISSPKQAKMAQVMQQPTFQAHKSIWSKSCLLPSAPLRPPLLAKEDLTKSPHTSRKLLGSVRRKPVDDPRLLEDDALILKVIEAYCTSAKTRHTVNSSLLDCPSMLIAEEEKIIIEETSGNQTVVQEKSLVDTVYHLKDQVKELRHEYRRIRRDLDDERKSRKRLENMIRKSLKSLVETTWEEVTNA